MLHGSLTVEALADDTASVASGRASEDPLCACLRRMAGGDQGALAELYDATAQRVYAVALRFVRDSHEAEEVVSDVYYQAWKEAHRYDPQRGSVRTWLLMCCRSRALDWLRRREAPHAGIDPDELEHVDGGGMAAGAIDLLDSIERRSALHHALQGLEPLQRQLIALSFFRGYSHAEIALRERMPLGTVKTHIRSAMSALRHALCELRE